MVKTAKRKNGTAEIWKDGAICPTSQMILSLSGKQTDLNFNAIRLFCAGRQKEINWWISTDKILESGFLDF